ncbi:MAG: hypothetical protein FJ290_30850 [Planctomycetes bacterium]|nr:hypothetical protein [Planctomycetota bacterium]
MRGAWAALGLGLGLVALCGCSDYVYFRADSAGGRVFVLSHEDQGIEAGYRQWHGYDPARRRWTTHRREAGDWGGHPLRPVSPDVFVSDRLLVRREAGEPRGARLMSQCAAACLDPKGDRIYALSDFAEIAVFCVKDGKLLHRTGPVEKPTMRPDTRADMGAFDYDLQTQRLWSAACAAGETTVLFGLIGEARGQEGSGYYWQSAYVYDKASGAVRKFDPLCSLAPKDTPLRPPELSLVAVGDAYYTLNNEGLCKCTVEGEGHLESIAPFPEGVEGGTLLAASGQLFLFSRSRKAKDAPSRQLYAFDPTGKRWGRVSLPFWPDVRSKAEAVLRAPLDTWLFLYYAPIFIIYGGPQ